MGGRILRAGKGIVAVLPPEKLRYTRDEFTLMLVNPNQEYYERAENNLIEFGSHSPWGGAILDQGLVRGFESTKRHERCHGVLTLSQKEIVGKKQLTLSCDECHFHHQHVGAGINANFWLQVHRWLASAIMDTSAIPFQATFITLESGTDYEVLSVLELPMRLNGKPLVLAMENLPRLHHQRSVRALIQLYSDLVAITQQDREAVRKHLGYKT